MELVNVLETSSEAKKPKCAIAFYGPTGVGKTTLLVNIARTIQKQSAYKPSICVLDLDCLFPTTLFKLHQDDLSTSSKSIHDYLEANETEKNEVFEDIFITHLPTDIHFINHISDANSKHNELFTFEKVNNLIDKCKEKYDLVLLDLPARFKDDAVNSGLYKSDYICFVFTEDIAHLVHGRKQLALLKQLEKSTDFVLLDKVKLLFNKELPQEKKKAGSIMPDVIQSTLYQRPILGGVHINQDINYHHNHGNLACDYLEVFRKDLEKIACQLYPFELEEIQSEKKIDLKRNKESWINLYGSEHLKNCTLYRYNCQRLYVEERAHQEFPDWVIDFDNVLQLGNRSCPSPEALQMEIAIRKELDDDLNIRVMWNKEKFEEVLVIENYLDKYRLYKRLR